MSNLNIWDASFNGDFDRIKYLIEVERVDIESKDQVRKIKYLIY